MLFPRHHSFFIIHYLLSWDSLGSTPCPPQFCCTPGTDADQQWSLQIIIPQPQSALKLAWRPLNLWTSQRTVLESWTKHRCCEAHTKASSGAKELNTFVCINMMKEDRHPCTESKCLQPVSKAIETGEHKCKKNPTPLPPTYYIIATYQ